jgi:two-component system, NtrC family, C4-dicarboxylate transport sensor histidine kinase DctB
VVADHAKTGLVLMGIRIARPGWLLTLVLMVLVSTTVFYIWTLVSLSQDHRRSSAIFEQSLTASIDQFEYLPALLARDERIVQQLVQMGNASDNLSQDLEFAARRSGADRIYVLDLSGTVTAASNYREDVSFVGQNYGYRPYFTGAIESRHGEVYFAKGATTGIPGLFISSPVIDQERVIGVVVVKLELSALLDSWKSSKDQVLVSDNNGVVILTPEKSWMYRLIRPLPEAAQVSIAGSRQFPGEHHSPLFVRNPWLDYLAVSPADFWVIGGVAYLADHFPIADTGWTLHHVVALRTVLFPVLVFLVTASLMSLVLYLLMLERRKKAMFLQQARAAEVRRREDLQRLIDHIHIGVVVFDHQGGIHSMNDHACSLLLGGAAFRSGGDLQVMDLLQLDSMAALAACLLDHRRSPQYFETGTRIGEQPVPVMFALSQVNYDGRDHYLMTLVNIAKRKRAEDELVRLNASLEETVASRTHELQLAQQALLRKSKAAALGKMAATIVHELSQPLAAMNSSVVAIENKIKYENWTGVRESAARLRALSGKMQKVIQLLKHFSYEDNDRIEDIDVALMVRQALDACADQLSEKGVDLLFHNHLAERCCRVRMSPLKLDLALSNLLKNALDAVEKVATPWIAIELKTDNGYICLSVEDNGGGVDQALVGQLFNPYVTTKEVGKGIGLGLSITWEIVQQQQGRLDFCNRAEGACFTLALPLVSEPLPATDHDGHAAA